MWLVFISQHQTPYQIGFTLGEPGSGPEMWQQPTRVQNEDGKEHGDGCKWNIDLGPPFLNLTLDFVNDQQFCERAVATLRFRVGLERLMLMRFLQFIPVLPGATKWTTNEPGLLETRVFQFWDSTPGANIERLCQTAVPLLTNMAIHFEHQNDPMAYQLIPLLKWFKDKGMLDSIGEGLYWGLQTHAEQGLPPAYSINRKD
jgi:hypothetical protein